MNGTVVTITAFFVGKDNQIHFLQGCLNDATGLFQSDNSIIRSVSRFGSREEKQLEKKPTPNRAVSTESHGLRRRIVAVEWQIATHRLVR